MKKFFYMQKDEKIGPIDLEELKNLYLEEDALVWEQGTTEWKKAKELEELAGFLVPVVQKKETKNLAEKFKIQGSKWKNIFLQKKILIPILLFPVFIVGTLYFVIKPFGGGEFNGKNYELITSPITGRVWLDRNIGADRECEHAEDEECFGDYFQWGRPADGHEKNDSEFRDITSETITPEKEGITKFILAESDWTTADQGGQLRQKFLEKTDGKGGCPKGFYVPSEEDIEAENLQNPENAFAKLKIPLSGLRGGRTEGIVLVEGLMGGFWSSTPFDLKAIDIGIVVEEWREELRIHEQVKIGADSRVGGLPIRCIKAKD